VEADVTEQQVGVSRDQVVDRYSSLAKLALVGGTPLDCSPEVADDACFGAAAYAQDAPKAALRASLGCGNPLAVAELRPGETVLDLGSGGGLDVLLSARRVGPTGRVIGLDASTEMLELARANTAGAPNVEFLAGHIEDIPLPDATVDVVISNCVINLSTDKPRALAEAFRVLRPGGRLGISDIVAGDDPDPTERREAEQLVGCSVGTLTVSEYKDLLIRTGFVDVAVRPVASAGGGLYSAIVQARRPAVAED
jgi:SAM-dependent methyltransferase